MIQYTRYFAILILHWSGKSTNDFKQNTDTRNIISGNTTVPFATYLKGINKKHTLSFKWDDSDLNNVKLVFYIDDVPMRKI